MATPELRFLDEEGNNYPEWKEKTLGDMCNIKTGKLNANAMVEFGKYRFFTCAKEYYYIDDYAFDTEALLISGNGANVGYIHYYKGKFNAYQRTYVLDNFNENIGYVKTFLDYKLKSHIKNEKNEGNTPYIVLPVLSNFAISFPSLPEQQKIANLFSLVDGKIENIGKQVSLWKQYKQGLSQQLFTQQLRFVDEDGNTYPDWEEKKLGEIANFYRGKNLGKSDMSEDGNHLGILYGQLFGKYTEKIDIVFSKTNSEGTLGLMGDVLMPTSDVTPDGLATASYLHVKNVQIGGDINIIRPFEFLDGLYLTYLLRYKKQDIIRLVSGSTVKHIYIKDIKSLEFSLPSLQEQQKIANLLSTVDEKIENLETQENKWKLYKQALMQKMFV